MKKEDMIGGKAGEQMTGQWPDDLPFPIAGTNSGLGYSEEQEDYETTFEEFWKEIVESPDGSLNIDQVKRELHDFWVMMGEVPKVYCHVSGGLISKANTCSEAVIEEADAVLDRMIQERLEEEKG